MAAPYYHVWRSSAALIACALRNILDSYASRGGPNPSASGGHRRSRIRVWDQHPDHPILPGREEKLAIASSADMQVCPRDARPHRSIDEFSHRYTHPVTIRVPYIELDFFDRRDGSRDTVVGLLHFGEIGREQTSTLDIAKDELAAERCDPAVIREPVGYRPTLV